MSSEEELDYDDDDVEEEVEDAPVEQKKRKTKKAAGKKAKDPNKPKRNMSAYFLFSNANRAQIKSENPDASFGDLAKLISERYKVMSEKERAMWDKEAMKDKARYEEEMQHYASADEDSDNNGGKKKKKAKKDPNAPKRNMSAYFLFSIAVRSAYKDANPDASFGDLAKIISQGYKELSEKDKQKWTKKAENDKMRYQKEMLTYNA